MTCRSCSSASSAECDIMVNLKIVFLDLVGTSQETRNHAGQAKGLSEEDGMFGTVTYIGRVVV